MLRRGLDRLRPAPVPLPLTRNEFYLLADSCRQYARDLARLDPQRVNLRECNRFNGWLRHVRRYDLLAPRLWDVASARPIARWQLASLGLVLMVALWLILPGRVERTVFLLAVNTLMFLIISLFMLPESLYGTTVEMIEAKLLRVVLELEALLQHDALQFSDAAFFKARDNLEAARAELRQQLDAAHRT